MENNEIYQRLTSVLRAELRQPALQISSQLMPKNVAGWDSVAMVGIILSVEDEFGFEMSSSDLRSVRSVGDLANIVARHWSKQNGR